MWGHGVPWFALAAIAQVLEAWDLHKEKMSALFPGHLDDLGLEHLKSAKESVRRARITQLERVICKAFLKSKKPLERVQECMAEYAQETLRNATEDTWIVLSKHKENFKSTKK